ncbi:MAG TPA: MarR family transcriptional regulator [Solirubrobacterales bacterium]|nr:MarR family transcriptional regulator [Solirubrobacterales bacterium]
MSEQQPSAEEVVFALRTFELERDRFDDAVARGQGISRTDLQALDHLHINDGLTPGQLADRMMLTSGAITALADRLEELGWLTREAHPSDRRSTVLRLTERAHATADRIFDPFAAEITDAAAGLSPAEREACRRFLAQAAALADRHAERIAQQASLGG